MKNIDVIIIGAGAAGLMCAIEAGKRGRSVMVLDHANKPGKKILMSGGGRCNFTNYNIEFDNFLSQNPSFCKSALSRYTQWDFIAMVNKHKIAFHEKKHGQLFCDNKAKDIVDMLLAECALYNVKIFLNTGVNKIDQSSNSYTFTVSTDDQQINCESLVIATGGLSIPTMGASPFGYKVAEQFGIKVWPTRAGLVPLTLHTGDKDTLAELSGIAAPGVVRTSRIDFQESILFTHRGLSGPAILQASSYWQAGEAIHIDLLHNIDMLEIITDAKIKRPKMLLQTLLAEYLPKRIVLTLLANDIIEQPLQSLSHKQISSICDILHNWQIKPNGTEGYRTAEVTLGGVDCDAISSKTMQAKHIPGLFFIGEVLDVAGWLGGFNFQWAWSSGWVAGQCV